MALPRNLHRGRSLVPQPNSGRRLIARLAHQYPDPAAVQRLILSRPYNTEPHGETLSSAVRAFAKQHWHCLEASMLAAAILSIHGHPPLVLSLGSVDDLDHVVYVFRQNGHWGAISRSRYEGLQGRRPVYRSSRDLVCSYLDPFVDETGEIISYAIANLDDTGVDWRTSPKNVWKVERYLIEFPHRKLRLGRPRYRKMLARYRQLGGHPRQSTWA